jgi:glutathione-specific gamma-glutamylcyclotransferase
MILPSYTGMVDFVHPLQPRQARSTVMPHSRHPLSLTADMVALVERIEPDQGPTSEMAPITDADFAELVERLLSQYRPRELWVFAYGSLIWKPAFTAAEHRRATAYGWHRSFCMELVRFRGTREQPGLMMALDRGGCCHGVAYRLPKGDMREQLGTLLRREMSTKHHQAGLARVTNFPRWLTVEAGRRKLRALAFAANRRGMTYVAKLPAQDVARRLARAAGHMGSGAYYLFQTVAKLEEHGIHDSGLWHLQKLVADELCELAEKGWVKDPEAGR